MDNVLHGQLDIVDINVILLRKGNKLNSTTEAIGHSSKNGTSVSISIWIIIGKFGKPFPFKKK